MLKCRQRVYGFTDEISFPWCYFSVCQFAGGVLPTMCVSEEYALNCVQFPSSTEEKQNKLRRLAVVVASQPEMTKLEKTIYNSISHHNQCVHTGLYTLLVQAFG